MKNIGLFYGSDTGTTEMISEQIINLIGQQNVIKHDIFDTKVSDFENYDCIILGLSTWYDGELQSDWEDYFDDFKQIDFTGKTVAIFGLGDQIGYGEWFCDGVGILAKVVEENGGKVIGLTKKDDSFEFESSIALKDENTFWGLCLDEDNQDELTSERLENWYKQIKSELNV